MDEKGLFSAVVAAAGVVLQQAAMWCLGERGRADESCHVDVEKLEAVGTVKTRLLSKVKGSSS